MTTTSRTIFRSKGRPSRGTRQAGYVVSAGVNLVLLYIVNNILEWGWLPFLTKDFEQVLPVMRLSLILSAVLNVIFLAYDAIAFKAIAEIGLSVVALIVIVRTYQVFPFEFSGGPWNGLTRAILILAGFGVSVGIIAEIIQLARGKKGWVQDA